MLQLSNLIFQIPTKTKRAKAENFKITRIELKRKAALAFSKTSEVTKTKTRIGNKSTNVPA
ncbi:Uncharacterised protein [Streptococcus pneumoniae]|nr:Uncharacterised protein [Streptococcus pneumoniae]CEW66356.1 Uncharacterised protein [Streptococcus pneumoniae]CGF56261.1 Uncharacterised protein [Streptococcus pneumoniae]CIW19305.1 Uncharacterised protein [Streptococcus pneumoniae]CJD79079.1 Uncharacterised protein [Streptococcus pneumoniae]